MTTVLTILLLTSGFSSLRGQTIQGLNYNHAILNELESSDFNQRKAVNNSMIVFDTLFFEDFSTYHYTVFPKADRWLDNYAFINSTYPDSMISLGVATLDALDETGYPYYTTINTAVPSDVLTSCPFDFTSDVVGKTYFSFFYQAGGKGNRPEGIDTTMGDTGNGSDTLLLDFYHPDSNRWENVFYTLDNSNPSEFKSVIFQIDQHFLKDSFQFRFRNYTSAEANNIQGKDLGYISNNDQWHIDYIRMHTTDDSTVLAEINDITITEPLLPSLETYYAVPYHHLPIAQANDERETIPFNYYIGFPNQSAPLQVFRGYQSFNLETGKQYRDVIYDNNLSPNTVYAFDDFFTAGFQYNPNNELGEFEFLAYLETDDADQPLINDTVRRRETFYDHYAYDDGSAENSFGLGGETQDINGFAVRFRQFKNPQKPDMLHAVLVYFAKAIDSASVYSAFQLSIRGNDGGVPASEALHVVEGAFPDYSTDLNGFKRITIDPPIAVDDTFYVVIRQLNGYVGIGYDINTDKTEHILSYTITGEGFGWTPLSSGQKGALMIRPSFKADDLIPVEEIAQDEFDLRIYPNPCTNKLFISVPDDESSELRYTIYNIVGLPMLQSEQYYNGIDVGTLPQGIYFLQVSNREGQLQKTVKFIKE